MAGVIGWMMKACESRELILVGPKHLDRMFDAGFIGVPDRNAWLDYKRVRSDLVDRLAAMIKPVVLFCAGMMSNVLIDDLSKEDGVTLIDCGSVFDPYVGVCSRKYHAGIMKGIKR